MNCRSVKPKITFSVVSHNQDSLVESLVHKILLFTTKDYDLVVTFNTTPSDHVIKFLSGIPTCKIIINESKKGFGANHNQAFRTSQSDIFVVLNPDICFNESLIPGLTETLSSNTIGAWGPRMVYSNGDIQESARNFPTIFSLLRRHIGLKKLFDYPLKDQAIPRRVDWISGAFMAFNSQIYQHVGGFDESYFMYFEDVAICKSLYDIGKVVIYDPRHTITHDSQRKSHRNLVHFLWHLKSAFIFLSRN